MLIFKSPKRGVELIIVLYRVAQKECNTDDQYFQETEGQNEEVVCIIACTIIFFLARWHQDP